MRTAEAKGVDQEVVLAIGAMHAGCQVVVDLQAHMELAG